MKRSITLLLILLLYGMSAAAITPKDVPEPLKPWINWVLADENQYQCPFFFQDFQDKHCSWPGTLSLKLQAAGGSFDIGWTLYRQDWVTLPGDREHWPQQVSIANQAVAVAVIAKDDKPAIQLPAGHYQISGRFFWDTPPESLAIPDSVGLIRLAIDGKDIVYPEIKQGALWLNADAGKQADDGRNRLDIQVFRQIIDDVPLQVVTRLELEVSGAAREVSLPHALLPAFIPVELNSPLPARIEADGRLQVQVRPGRWSIQIQSRHPAPLTQLDFGVADAEWPQSEVWVFQAMPALRLVEIEKLASIDGSQTNLPGEWRHLPAYQVKQGDSMVFKVIRRGDPEPEPNQLNLNRKLWLDFDGGGYTVNDRIAGTMTLDWRLNALPDTQLGQVLLNGQNQLITQLGDGRQGVEVRRGAIDLNADSRITGPIDAPSVTGWQQRFKQVNADLNVPPGWRLLAVSGVDNVPDSWLTHWTLLDLFLVLIAALAVGRLWHWQWGLFALISLVLIWHEADAPQLIWLHILAALALIRVLPANRFLRWVTWYRNACWLALLVIVMPFMIAQIRIGLYPQLEKPWQVITGPAYSASADAGGAQMMEMEAAPAMAEKSEERMFKKNRANSAAPASLAKPAVNFDRIDPDANLQTGPGLPQWQWQQLHLSWNGAVDSGQQIRLWYLSPSVTMLLHFVQALLTAVLALRMLGLVPNVPWKLPNPTLACVMALLLLPLPAQKVYADYPDQAMLDQLKSRLLEAPQCLPACAEIAAMNVGVKPAEMLIELEVHAQQDVAVPLPAALEQWMPERIGVDGNEATALIRGDDDVLWLALNQGVHKVVLSGRHAAHDRFSLPLPLPPQHTVLKTDGWRVEGVYEDGRVGPQLEFSRLDTGSAAVLKQSALPAFVRIERILHLGLDWRVTTRVLRLAGGDSAIVLELPLLAGEAITSPEIRVKDGEVLVNMAAGQSELEWQSQLKKTETLELKAAETSQWSELWRADVSPIWRIQASGIAVVHHQDAQGIWMPEWRPWPGETVKLDISRPQAVAGATLTIDKSELRINPGKRSEDAELKFGIRSSKGGLHTVILPEQAVLQSVLIDGVTQPIRQKAETVTLPIRPGAQQLVLSWQSPIALRALLTTPRVNLGADSVNSHIQVVSGEDRWVLCTWGPKFGPAALIWGLLIVLALLAAGLGKIGLTPLRRWQWFLLLIGLSQLHIASALLVVGWLLALGWREGHVLETNRRFNLVQIGLALLTLASLALLFAAVEQGLLGTPDMQITGNQSTAYNLNWYQDRTPGELPTATVVSLPLMAYRLLMLAWSLWMAVALLDWLRWGWGCFASEGIWKSKLIKAKA